MEEYQTAAPDKNIREQLNGMFTRYDYVGVVNPLKTEFAWQVALEQNEIVNVNQADPMDEGRMAQQAGGTFLPGDSTVRQRGKLVVVRLAPGEKRMIPGEAAYVVVPRIFNALVRSRFGATKAGLARLRNPSTQTELLKEIVVGPLVNNIGDAIQTYADTQMRNIEGFTDVQVNPPTTPEPLTVIPAKPKGFSDPAVLAKAQATRNANKAAQARATQ